LSYQHIGSLMRDDFMRAARPKCHSEMAFVIALPYPKSLSMLKTTFLCQPCNRTCAYSLSPEMAEQYQPDLQPDQPIEAAGNIDQGDHHG